MLDKVFSTKGLNPFGSDVTLQQLTDDIYQWHGASKSTSARKVGIL
ncbi:hypothetical protein GCM10011391_11750 [Pullulanibacillus camelliae]|uniref:Uncharacterized protein n=1 Tax=Pullulanibacillus camelliae TaxID=1707096 RepID=A0A8J2YGA8_9BACL|nr:hypothetical protein [Pullulanibacillus camelliae]GGE34777.1 hypothetical protein GCM10011391_11750 [Pullulanibacillus camelliae]